MLKVFISLAATAPIAGYILYPTHVATHADFRASESRTMAFAACDYLRAHTSSVDYASVARDFKATVGDVVIYCAVTDSGRY